MRDEILLRRLGIPLELIPVSYDSFYGNLWSYGHDLEHIEYCAEIWGDETPEQQAKQQTEYDESVEWLREEVMEYLNALNGILSDRRREKQAEGIRYWSAARRVAMVDQEIWQEMTEDE